MKKIFIALLLLFSAVFAVPAGAEDRMNRELGYFENTRTVLLAEAAYGSRWAAGRMDRELSRIFRYPYYRTLSAEGKSFADFGEVQAEAVARGADIAVRPVAAEFSQFRHYPPMFFDADPVVTTRARLAISYWEEGMESPRTIETSFFDSQIEGPDTDADDIFDRMWKRLMKKFPYRRVPTDRSRNLSGEISEQKAEGSEQKSEVRNQ